MTYGMFDALITDKADSDYFRNGRYLGKGMAQIANMVEIVGGSSTMIGSVTVMAGTGGLSLAAAAPTGGGSVAVTVPVLAVEAIPLVGGFALTAHGVSSLMFSSTRGIDSVPQIQNKGMLGKDGAQIDGSQTLWQGKQGRLDVENPSPGNRLGSIHFQPWSNKGLNFQYDPYASTFLPSNGIRPPRYLENLFSSNRGFIRAIGQGLRILGEIR